MEVRTETIEVKSGRPHTLTSARTTSRPGRDIHCAGRASGRRSGAEASSRSAIPSTTRFAGLLAMMRARDATNSSRRWAAGRSPAPTACSAIAKGNIGFKTVLALPIRSAHSLLDDRAAHEGWDSANDWQGFLPHELLPQVINPKQGWLVSANHRPIASFYPISLGISTGSMGDTDRSWRLKERVKSQGQVHAAGCARHSLRHRRAGQAGHRQARLSSARRAEVRALPGYPQGSGVS